VHLSQREREGRTRQRRRLKTLITKFVEWVVYNASWLLLGGFVDYLASQYSGVVGSFTGWMAMGLGASGAMFCQWRKEPGLWMPSGLFLAINLPIFVVIVYGPLSDLAQAGVPSLLACDIWRGSLFLAAQILFLATVTRTNWSPRKKPEMPEF
jgi:hypothetical protein